MKIGVLVFIFFASLIIKYLHNENKKKSDVIKKKMQKKVQISKKIKEINESKYNMHKISRLLTTMIEESNLHVDVNPSLSDTEIIDIENKINLTLPLSYKLFLKYFGDGGTWIYANTIDSIRNRSWLSDSRNFLNDTIELEDKKLIKVSTLLCLMTEDSNGGAWCWLTSIKDKNGEWPLAYYSLHDKKLHYKVTNFTEWLKILIESKGEVIRTLDVDFKLGLG